MGRAFGLREGEREKDKEGAGKTKAWGGESGDREKEREDGAGSGDCAILQEVLGSWGYSMYLVCMP